MTTAVIFMAIAAFQAQTAYNHCFDGPLVGAPHVNSAIRLGLAGLACFVAAKVMVRRSTSTAIYSV